MADNYVVRERYTGVQTVGGQVLPVRGDVVESELAPITPIEEAARNNGGGAKRRRRTSEE